MGMHETNTVLKACEGEWGRIIRHFCGNTFDQALKNIGRHVPCPQHGGKDGFRLFKDFDRSGGGCCNSCGIKASGVTLISWHTGTPYGVLINDIGDFLGLEPISNNWKPRHQKLKHLVQQEKYVAPFEQIDPVEVKRDLDRMRFVWQNAIPLNHSTALPGRLYLTQRSINPQILLDNPCVRFHPRLAYYDADGNFVADYSALVFLFLNHKQDPVNILRIYVTMKGEPAPVGKNKKLMKSPAGQSVSGSCIWLAPPAAVIGTAEGVETGAAVQLASNLPMAACGNATLLERFVADPLIKVWHNFCDKDRSKRGHEAAKFLTDRIRVERPDIQLFHHFPPGEIPENKKSLDWHNIWEQQGRAGFAHLRLMATVSAA